MDNLRVKIQFIRGLGQVYFYFSDANSKKQIKVIEKKNIVIKN